jgi:hypothetical protein
MSYITRQISNYGNPALIQNISAGTEQTIVTYSMALVGTYKIAADVNFRQQTYTANIPALYVRAYIDSTKVAEAGCSIASLSTGAGTYANASFEIFISATSAGQSLTFRVYSATAYTLYSYSAYVEYIHDATVLS